MLNKKKSKVSNNETLDGYDSEECSLLSEASDSIVIVEKKHDQMMSLQTISLDNDDTSQKTEENIQTMKKDTISDPNVENNNDNELKQNEVNSTLEVNKNNKKKWSICSYLEEKLPSKIQDGIRQVVLYVKEHQWNINDCDRKVVVKCLFFALLMVMVVGMPFYYLVDKLNESHKRVNDLETQVWNLQQELGTMRIWRKKAKIFQEEIVSLKNELYSIHRRQSQKQQQTNNCPPSPNMFSFENSWFKASADFDLGEDGKLVKGKVIKYLESMKESMNDYLGKQQQKSSETRKEIDYTDHIIDPFNSIVEGIFQSFQ